MLEKKLSNSFWELWSERKKNIKTISEVSLFVDNRLNNNNIIDNIHIIYM